MTYCGKILNLQRKQHQFDVQSDNGLIRISIIRPDVIRIRATQKPHFSDYTSPIIDKDLVEKASPDNISFKEYDDFFLISTPKLSIRIDIKDSTIILLDENQKLLSQDIESAFFYQDEQIGFRKNIAKDMFYFGLGERFGKTELRGEKAILYNIDALGYNTEKQLYLSIPFIMACKPSNDPAKSSFYGLYSDNTYKTIVDFTNIDSFSFVSEGGEVDYYFIYGKSPARIIQTFTRLTGRMDMPPLWSLGYHQSRWGYKDSRKMLQLEKTFKEKDIPCDVMHLDIQYMNGKRVFTWDNKHFPEPDNMLKYLKDRGVHIVNIIDPGVKKEESFRIYKEGLNKSLFCKDSQGKVFYGEVWPGITAFPDFFKEETREWWAGLVASMIRSGVSGIWNDMNEPVLKISDNSNVDNPDMYHEYEGKTYPHKALRNLYANFMAIATKMGIMTEKPDDRPFILTRSGFAGIQKYACVWTGDNVSNWRHLRLTIPMLLTLGLSGVSFCGADVGGFTYRLKKLLVDVIKKRRHPTKELYARWIEMACLTPFFRTHTILYSKEQEPWSFGRDVEDISRKYISLRYSLMPYLYNLFYLSHKEGLPVMRPVFLNYPDDLMSYEIDDEYMIGDDIIVSPVLEKKTEHKYVYLPKGKWINYHTGEEIKGKKKVLVKAPLDILPLFIRKGSIIPTYEDIKLNTYGLDKSPLMMSVYIDRNGEKVGDYTLYEDDGFSNDYKKNIYSETNYSYHFEGNFISFNIKRTGKYFPKYKIIRLILKDLDKEMIPEKIELISDYEQDIETSKEIIKVSKNINYKTSTGFCWFIENSNYFPDTKNDIVIIIPNRENLSVKLRIELTKI